MQEFAASVNEFLSFHKFKVLKNKDSVSRQQAIEKSEQEYDIFNKTQKIESDFDKQVKQLQQKL
ncbi:MAG: virulence RhuM family protein [Bacteroidales bacterium]|nr:virulence RhuM family protein [Bacteroidales bacterium]